MYKMVFKLALPYLCDLCPNFVSERSSRSLRSANNLSLPFFRTERHRQSFLFSSIQELNSLQLETHIAFSRYLQAQPFKIPAFSIPQLSYLHRGSLTVNFLHSFET